MLAGIGNIRKCQIPEFFGYLNRVKVGIFRPLLVVNRYIQLYFTFHLVPFCSFLHTL